MAVTGKGTVGIRGTAVPAHGNVDGAEGATVQKCLIAHRFYTVRQSDLSQTGTAAKSKTVDLCEGRGERNFGKGITALQCTGTQRGHLIGNGQDRKAGTGAQSICTDGFHIGRNGDFRKTAAAFKTIIGQCLKAFGKQDLFQFCTALECIVGKTGDTVRYHHGG